MANISELLNHAYSIAGADVVTRNFMEHMIGAESGGKASARNSNSSAQGLTQMLDGTWKGMVKAHPGKLTNRNDPGQQVLAGLLYAQDNAASLRRAGHEITEGNLYLAHFLGSGGANKVLSADPRTPLSAVVGSAVMNSNKSVTLEYKDKNGVHHKKAFANFTVGDVRAWTTKKMGGRIRYDLLDQEVQDNVTPWVGDNENPRNNFQAVGDMVISKIVEALVTSLVAGLFGKETADALVKGLADANQNSPTPPSGSRPTAQRQPGPAPRSVGV